MCICPYCKLEMEKGVLHAASGSGLYWVPEGKDRNWLSYLFQLSNKKIEENIKDRGGVMLVSIAQLGGINKEAYICKNCKKVISDYT